MLLFLYLHASKWLFSLAWSESQFKKKWGGGGGVTLLYTMVLIDYLIEIYTSKLGGFFLTLFQNIWMPPLILLQGYFKGFFDA